MDTPLKWAGGWNGKVTLLVLPLGANDVILGMAWLKKHNPRVDWKTGTCVVTPVASYAKVAAAAAAAAERTDSKGEKRKANTHNLSAAAVVKKEADLGSARAANGSVEKNRSVLCLLTAKQWRREMRNGGEGGVVFVQREENKQAVETMKQQQGARSRGKSGLSLNAVEDRGHSK